MDVTKPTCNIKGYNFKPSFAKKIGEKPTMCSEHGKPLGVVNVVIAKCAIAGCKISPTWGKSGESATHCSKHGKQAGLEQLNKAKRCKVAECDKVVLYGEESGNPEYCRQHGEERGLVDVMGKKCKADGCTTRPTYGIAVGTSPSHCATHGKELGMVPTDSRKCAVPVQYGLALVYQAELLPTVLGMGIPWVWSTLPEGNAPMLTAQPRQDLECLVGI